MMFLDEWISSPVLRRLTFVAIAMILVYVLMSFVRKALNKSIKSNDNKYKARKAVNVLGYILFISSIIFIYNEQLGNFGVVLGVTGAGVAFALQEVIVSIAGWVFIVVSNSVSVGQRIKVGELKGDIIDIGIMSTTLMEIGDWVNGDLYNGRIITLANSFVFKEKIQNYSNEYPFLWDEIEVPIRHGSNTELSKKIFKEIADLVCGEYSNSSAQKWKQMSNKYKVEHAEVQPMITMVFNQNWITFTIRYIVDYKMRRTTKDQIFTKILEEIRKTQDQIQIASSALEVELKSENSAKA